MILFAQATRWRNGGLLLNDRKHNVFAWLDDVRARPGMFIYRNRGSLHELETMAFGYHRALLEHGIVETVPDFCGHFSIWLYYRTKWSTNRGWSVAIEEHTPEPEKRLATFFELVDEFRKLRPSMVCTVKLAPHHNPMGKRVTIGMNGRIAKPTRIDVMRYRPEPLHFLRFHYGRRVHNQELLMTGSGDYATDAQFAKQWVNDELQVEFERWDLLRKGRRTKG